MAEKAEFDKGIALPTLITQLKAILHQYPDDGQILKELLQNAEDAGARKVVFLLDSTAYPSNPEKLRHRGLVDYQGPALYVYNDAMFTEADWRGIRMLSDSVKQADPMKVGRFGLGFKSVFHITDLPSIFSGNGIGFLDPHERFFRNDETDFPTSSYLFDLNKSRETIEQLQDQFLPYFQRLFGVTKETFERGLYEGTMFRFPLRMDGMQSDLSDTKYSPKEVRNLFKSLETDAHIMLLFLKSLECIEVYEKTSNTVEDPVKILTIRISDAVRESVREKRQELIKEIEARRNGNISGSTSVTYALNVELQRHQKTETQNETLETTQWVISQYYAGRSELGSAGGISDDLGLLPWVGVALRVSSNNQTAEDPPSYLRTPKGHIFCFLPLPLEENSPTGLRVHVHGYFAVDSNRRHIKWPTADQKPDQLTDKDLLWNMFLVNTLTAKALVNLALHVSDPSNSLRRDLVFDIIPDQVTPQWKQLAENFHRELPNLDIFHSPSPSGGKWMNCRTALFDNCEDKSTGQELIRRLLIQNQVSFASVPLFLMQHFTRRVTPEIVCECLKAIQDQICLKDEEKCLLLKYLLDNVEDPNSMVNVKLLPLEGGSWTEFEASDHCKGQIFIDSDAHPKSLYPGLEERFLRTSTPVFQQLSDLAKLNVTQLIFLDASVASQVLRSVFPSDWKNRYRSRLSEPGNLSMEWLERLWRYMSTYFSSDLSDFEEFHIIPVAEDHVVKLKAKVPIMVSKHSGYELNEEMKELMGKFGITVVDSLPSWVQSHPQVIGKYVALPDACSVLDTIMKVQNVGALDVDNCLRSSENKYKVLQMYLASGLAGKTPLEIERYKNILRSLPIFEALGERCTVTLNEVPLAAPTDLQLPIEVPRRLVDLRENLIYELAKKLGVQLTTSAQLLKYFIFPALEGGSYDKSDITTLMRFLCDNVSHYSSQGDGFTAAMRGVRFLDKRNGDMVAASEVFDHGDQVLMSLFAGDDVFSCGEFCHPNYRPFLQHLGIKGTDSVTASDLLNVANVLDSSSDSPDDQKACSFIQFLDANSHLLEELVYSKGGFSPLSMALRRLKWVKCDLKRPENYPKSLKYWDNPGLSYPGDVYSSQFGSVVGTAVPTVDVTTAPNVSRAFDWERQPNVSLVVQHLKNLIDSYEHRLILEYPMVIKEISASLNQSILTAAVGLDALAALKEIPWVWNGDGFAVIEKVVRTAPFMDLRPHVFHLPEMMQDFGDLWDHFHIQEEIDLVEIIRDIQLLHEDLNSYNQTKTERDLNMVVSILERVSTFEDKHDIVTQLLVPVATSDGRLTLKNIGDVTYVDHDSYHADSLESVEISLLHPRIRIETAKALNIHGVVNRMLGTEDLDFESYGQREPLTTRLSNLLRDYPDGLSVIKELIQNADDAGAREVRFVYDERSNEDAMKGLIDPGMAGLQGPALWAYNDAVFTDEDFRNLVKLSGATKERKRNKIGRFGLGFNAVYNLTDVPSLLSRNHVVFLDPHLTHLGSAIRDPDSPGIKLDIIKNRERLKLLKGQFKPYNGICDCDLGCDSTMTSYRGTLFRFPLRTKSQAVESEISKKHYSRNEMMELLQLLYQSRDSLILFTQHVESVSLFHMNEVGKMEEWLSIKKEIRQILRPLKELTSMDVTKCGSTLICSSLCDVLYQRVGSQFSPILPILESVNAIMNEVPSTPIPDVETSAVIEVTSALSNASLKSQNTEQETTTCWLISSCMGTGSSFDMATKSPDHGLTPVAGAAARLRKTGSNYEPVNLGHEQSGLLFCFLPLPIPSRFPVHINGSFAITSSRMHLCETTVNDKNDVRCRWNEVLFEDAVTRAYVIMLSDLSTLCPDADPYALWPVHKSLQDVGLLARLTDSLYNCICSPDGPKLLRSFSVDVAASFISFDSCLFLEPSFRRGTVGETGQEVFAQLKAKEAVDLPLDAIETIRQTSACDKMKSRMVTKVRFFEEIFIPFVSEIEERKRYDVTIYALFEHDLIKLFLDKVFFPVKPLGRLSKCTEMVCEKSDLAILFDLEDEVFPAIKETQLRTLNDIGTKLLELGMRETDLSWDEIVERCDAIRGKPALVSKRIPVLIKLMSFKVNSREIADARCIEEIVKIPFLPSLPKPSGFPLTWKGEKFPFASPEQSYLSEAKHLVCCSHPIVDERIFFNNDTRELKNILKLSNKHISENALCFQMQQTSSLTDQLSILTTESKKHIRNICNGIYGHLNKRSGLSEQCRKILRKMPCLLIEGSSMSAFMLPEKCAKILPGLLAADSLLPYACGIPGTISHHQKLLAILSIREDFSNDDYLQIIQKIKAKYSDGPCDINDLEVVLKVIIQCLLHRVTDLDLTKLFVPNQSMVLISAQEIHYSDATWDVDCIDDEDNIDLCHKRIPSVVAKNLGLKTIRDGCMDKYSYEADFGQREALIDRINRILTGYDFNEDVFKEMLQNADDAGATEIHFINDRRHLADERVFADKWKPLQGPALCVFNDKPFSKEDLVGIQSLGRGSKSDDLTKTGQYGVGFNCVYHLTDAPCLLTSIVGGERVLCVCDPSCKFVPRASSLNPGRMFRCVDSLKGKFPDVFEGFFEDAYQSKGGTMFRLPLRTGKLGDISEISKTTVDNQKVGELFDRFKENIFESLLFLHSVEKIHLKNVDENGEGSDYVVSAILSPEDKIRRQEFEETVKCYSRLLKNKQISIQDIHKTEISYELVTQDSEGLVDRWRIIQRFGFENNYLPSSIHYAYSKGKIPLLPRVGIALLLDRKRPKVSDTHLRNEVGLPPRFGIASPFGYNQPKVDVHRPTQQANPKSRFFCFLPLPVTIDFPVHINGHFALEYETRQQLRFHERGGVLTEWNKTLLTVLLADSYCSLLQERRDDICQKENGKDLLAEYFDLFPTVPADDTSYIKSLCQSIYSKIQDKNLAIFPVETYLDSAGSKKVPCWLGPRGTDECSWEMWTRMGWKGTKGKNNILSYYNNLPTVSTYSYGPRERSLRDILLNCGFMFYQFPSEVYKRLVDANVTVQQCTPEAVRAFFATYSESNTLCLVTDLPKPISSTPINDLQSLVSVIRYVRNNNYYNLELLNLPLQATEDNCLRCFKSNSVKFEPRFKDIAPHIKHQFLHERVFDAIKSNTTNSNLYRPFGVQDLALVISDILPKKIFNGGDKLPAIDEMLTHLKDPNRWLNEVWECLHGELLQLDGKGKEVCRVGQIRPLNDWCLLPATICGQQVLFPIHKFHSITKLNNISTNVASTLKMIGIPEPFEKIFTRRSASASAYDALLSETPPLESIVRGIIEVKFKLPPLNLSTRQCIALLEFLADTHTCIWSHIRDATESIRRLPIFVTAYNDVVSLEGCGAYIIPEEIPKDEMDFLRSTKGIVFLKSQSKEINLLLEMLNCHSMSLVDFYCEFIFQHFELLSPRGRLVHLTFVRDTLNTLQTEPYQETPDNRLKRLGNRQRLINDLQTLAFLPDGDGRLSRASEFYDKSNRIFAVMEDPKTFPTKPYDSVEWREFLIICGMVSTVTEKMFLDYANHVAGCALSGATDRLCKQSKVLVEHIFRSDSSISQGLLVTLKALAFVCPHVVDSKTNTLHPQYGDRDSQGMLRFISFRGATLSNFDSIVWSAQRLLPAAVPKLSKPNDGMLEKRMKELEIQETPTCETVAEHTNNLCLKWVSSMQEFQSSSRQAPDQYRLRRVMLDIYQFLASHPDIDKDEVRQILRETPLILDSQRHLLLKPENTVKELYQKDEIVPYLIQIPKDLDEFVELFQGLGATQEPTLDQYAMVLEKLHSASNDNNIEGNERQSAVKAIAQFFKRLRKLKQPLTLNRELILLGSDSVMHRSCHLVVDNSISIRRRVAGLERPFLIDLQQECDLTFTDQQLETTIKKLPADQQPSLLTAVVKEEIERNFTETESSLADRMQRKLHSEELRFGLVRLAHHRTANQEDFDEEKLHNALRVRKIRVIGVNRIDCYLVYMGKRIKNSEQQNSYFIDQEDKTACVMYIDEPKLMKDACGEALLFIKLVNVFQSLIGALPENSVSYVRCMFIGEPGRTDEMLDRFGIDRFTSRITPTEIHDMMADTWEVPRPIKCSASTEDLKHHSGSPSGTLVRTVESTNGKDDEVNDAIVFVDSESLYVKKTSGERVTCELAKCFERIEILPICEELDSEGEQNQKESSLKTKSSDSEIIQESVAISDNSETKRAIIQCHASANRYTEDDVDAETLEREDDCTKTSIEADEANSNTSITKTHDEANTGNENSGKEDDCTKISIEADETNSSVPITKIQDEASTTPPKLRKTKKKRKETEIPLPQKDKRKRTKTSP